MEACWLMAGLTTTRDIVAKLWNLCHILRDDGVTYNEYVTELTFLLFLKMMAETGRENISSTGFRRVKRGSAISMNGFWRRTPPRRNPAPGSILRRDRSSIASWRL